MSTPSTAPRLQLGDKVKWTSWDRHNGQTKLLYHWGTVTHLSGKNVQILCEDGKNRKFPRGEVMKWLIPKQS
jgi:hypothetical protein